MHCVSRSYQLTAHSPSATPSCVTCWQTVPPHSGRTYLKLNSFNDILSPLRLILQYHKYATTTPSFTRYIVMRKPQTTRGYAADRIETRTWEGESQAVKRGTLRPVMCTSLIKSVLPIRHYLERFQRWSSWNFIQNSSSTGVTTHCAF